MILGLNKKYKLPLIIVSTFILLLLCYFTIERQQSNFTKTVNNSEKVNNKDNKKSINYDEIIKDLKNKYSNEDIIGILEVINEDKKLPIAQTTNNDYYLNHGLDKKANDEGSIFLDYRVDIDSSKKLLVYGHSSNNIYTEFNFLQEFYDKEYYDTHKYLEITTSTTKKKYEIFSVYTETEDFSYMQTDFENESVYFSHLNKLKNNSIYDTNIELSATDEILIIQTCSMHSDYAKYQNKYLLIISRRV